MRRELKDEARVKRGWPHAQGEERAELPLIKVVIPDSGP